MNRMALSNRLEGLSKVFADGSPYKRELSAMACVLTNMAEEKFPSILDPEYNPDEPEAIEDKDAMDEKEAFIKGAFDKLKEMLERASQNAQEKQRLEEYFRKNPKVSDIIDLMATPKPGTPAAMPEPGPQGVKMPGQKMSNEENTGGYWNVEASTAVMNNLIRDVTGMDKSICCDTKQKLTPEQRPEGQHSGEKAKTLKPDQTPDQKDVLKSGIVEKSKGAVKKEAGDAKGPGIPDKDGKGPYGGTEMCPKSKKKEKKATEEEDDEKSVAQQKAQESAESKAEKKEEKAKQHAEEAAKALGQAEELEKKSEKSASEPTVIEAEGIELTAPMEEVELSEEEAKKLDQLFA